MSDHNVLALTLLFVATFAAAEGWTSYLRWRRSRHWRSRNSLRILPRDWQPEKEKE